MTKASEVKKVAALLCAVSLLLPEFSFAGPSFDDSYNSTESNVISDAGEAPAASPGLWHEVKTKVNEGFSWVQSHDVGCAVGGIGGAAMGVVAGSAVAAYTEGATAPWIGTLGSAGLAGGCYFGGKVQDWIKGNKEPPPDPTPASGNKSSSRTGKSAPAAGSPVKPNESIAKPDKKQKEKPAAKPAAADQGNLEKYKKCIQKLAAAGHAPQIQNYCQRNPQAKQCSKEVMSELKNAEEALSRGQNNASQEVAADAAARWETEVSPPVSVAYGSPECQAILDSFKAENVVTDPASKKPLDDASGSGINKTPATGTAKESNCKGGNCGDDKKYADWAGVAGKLGVMGGMGWALFAWALPVMSPLMAFAVGAAAGGALLYPDKTSEIVGKGIGFVARPFSGGKSSSDNGGSGNSGD